MLDPGAADGRLLLRLSSASHHAQQRPAHACHPGFNLKMKEKKKNNVGRCFYIYLFSSLSLSASLLFLQSVTKNGRSLLWVAALMVVIIYIYSLVSFAYLRKNFDEGEAAFCESSFQVRTATGRLVYLFADTFVLLVLFVTTSAS